MFCCSFVAELSENNEKLIISKNKNVSIFIKNNYIWKKNINHTKIKYMAKPFVKWVGGKSQLLTEISKKYPHNIEKYCEPFVRGGAVLFNVLQYYHPQEVYLQVKNQCEGVGVPAKAVGCSALR